MSTPKKRSKLIILLPSVWSIRNILHSGLLDHLRTVDLFLLIHRYDDSKSYLFSGKEFSANTNCQTLLVPVIKRRVHGLPFLKQVIESAFARRNNIGSFRIYKKWFERKYSGQKKIRAALIEFLGYVTQPAFMFNYEFEIFNKFYSIQINSDQIKAQLSQIKPDAILSTVNVEDTYERAYVLSAKQLGIPVINQIVSFDNLTSKPAHLIYDFYITWNQGMRDQLLRLYPEIKNNQVCITGAPQFDFHRQSDYMWSRLETLANLGLPSDGKYFLYGASTSGLTPEEPELIIGLLNRMESNEILKDYWLVVRPHPRDNWFRWDKVRKTSKRLILSNAWENNPDENGWAIPSATDYAKLTSSISHAAACINIASTMTLDAAILDRPVIGIRFDKESNAPREILYAEYDTDHYRPLVESGGLKIAQSWDELTLIMLDAINNPEKDQKQRLNMVKYECGQVDGNAAKRVAQAIIGFLELNNA